MTARTSACVLALLLPGLSALTACSDDVGARVSSDELVIGVSGTDPGLAMVDERDPRLFSGFEVDLASYVADGLGWDAGDVSFVIVDAPDRETALESGTVDLVVSAYGITELREERVDLAGPYLVAGQDLLVAEDSRVTGPASLDGQTVCVTAGSPDLDRIRAAGLPADALIREEEDTAACVDLLLVGEVDAVTSDDALLAGHAAQHPDQLRVVGSPFSTIYYGIGLPLGSPDVAVVDGLLARAAADGTWQEAVDRHLGTSGYTPPLPPAPGAGAA